MYYGETKGEEKAIDMCKKLITEEYREKIGINNQIAIKAVLDLVERLEEEIDFERDQNCLADNWDI